MSIPVSTLISNGTFLADVGGSQRYTFARDWKPAINLTVQWAVGVLNAGFASDKISEEKLIDLNYERVFETSTYGRVYMNPSQLGHQVWSVLGVSPEPVVSGTPANFNLPAWGSAYHPELAFISSPYSAKRLTQENWNESADDIFMPGNTILTGDYPDKYAFLCSVNYSMGPPQTAQSYSTGPELTIRPVPAGAKRLVSIKYLKVPGLVATENDSVEFPASMTQLLTARMMAYIAEQQGDGTNLWGTSSSDLSQIMAALG